MMTKNLPQGEVFSLSFLLRYFLVDGLLQEINKIGYKITGYAKNVTIVTLGKFEGSVSKLLWGAPSFVEV